MANQSSSVENSSLVLRVGEKAFYRCARDRVVNDRTNARAFAVDCLSSGEYGFVNPHHFDLGESITLVSRVKSSFGNDSTGGLMIIIEGIDKAPEESICL